MIFPKLEQVSKHSFISNNLNEQSVVVDLGATTGDFANVIIRRWGCKVFAVEPLEDFYSKIFENKKLILCRGAICSNNQTTSVKFFEGGGISTRDNYRKRSVKKSVDVEGIVFEDFLKNYNIGEIDLLKIDIEGGEFDLFDTTSDETFYKISQMSIEFHYHVWPELEEDVNRISKRLGALGFYKVDFNNDGRDVVFINKNIINLQGLDYMILESVKFYRRTAPGIKVYQRAAKRRFRAITRLVC